jgi:hypothetical protein
MLAKEGAKPAGMVITDRVHPFPGQGRGHARCIRGHLFCAVAYVVITDMVITDVVVTDMVITDIVMTDMVITGVVIYGPSQQTSRQLHLDRCSGRVSRVVTDMVVTDMVVTDMVVTDMVMLESAGAARIPKTSSGQKIAIAASWCFIAAVWRC